MALDGLVDLTDTVIRSADMATILTTIRITILTLIADAGGVPAFGFAGDPSGCRLWEAAANPAAVGKPAHAV